MEDLAFFDADCRIGIDALGKGETVGTLLSEMDELGVSRALVRGTAAGFGFSAEVSNETLVRELQEDREGRLTGVWCLLPDQGGALPPPDLLYGKMKECRIGALEILPLDHRWIPNRYSIGDYLDAAADRRIPVLLPEFIKDVPLFIRLLEDFPKNIFVINGNAKWGKDRMIRPVLRNFPNTYFNIAGYWVPQGILDLADLYGADRILFGSGFPVYTAASAMLALKHCGLDEGSVRKIAGTNLENLLKGAVL